LIPDFDALIDISKRFGDSFYLFDAAVFKRNFDDFTRAFKSHYNRLAIAYSYKTNYLPRLCRLVHGWGGYAEVVS
jgi:diaminopimelate decarboxylase